MTVTLTLTVTVTATVMVKKGGALVRWARAGHLFLTIPHPCLFLPSLTKQSGERARSVSESGPSFAPSL